MPTIDIVYFNAGGGHRATAQALRDVVAQQGRPWKIRLVNLVEVLDPDKRIERVLGMPPEDLYNRRLRRGWTLGMAQELRLWQGLARALHRPLVRSLSQHWARSEPDLVLSVVPNFSRALCESLNLALPGVPFMTLITDLADHPPHFWIEPGLPQTLLCPSEEALAQARAAGYAATQTALLSGVVLRPQLYARHTQPPLTHADLGLDAARPTGIVMFGAEGSAEMLRIAKALPEQQLLFICGRNAAVQTQLAALGSAAPHAAQPHTALGFVEDIASVLRLGDYFIGKPGPGALSEALHMGLPVITQLNAGTLPQERFNAHWVRQQGFGIVVRSWAQLAPAVERLLRWLPQHRQAVARLDNRALFEVPELLAEKLMSSQRPPTAGRSRWQATQPA
jgi:UDP-N-acetylglucosamine:LPS N-acetylglucosamine transferase